MRDKQTCQQPTATTRTKQNGKSPHIMRLRQRTTPDSSQEAPIRASGSKPQHKKGSPTIINSRAPVARQRRGVAPRRAIAKKERVYESEIEENLGVADEESEKDGLKESDGTNISPQPDSSELAASEHSPPVSTSLPASSDVPKTLSSQTHDVVEPDTASVVPDARPAREFDSDAGSQVDDYDDEPSYQPDPADPFGFFDAERKLQDRKQALKPLGDVGNKRKSLRQSTKLTMFALERDDDEDEEDEETPQAFATPKRSRLSRSQRQTGTQSSLLLPSSPEKTSIRRSTRTRSSTSTGNPVEKTPKLTTYDLELLLPKRKTTSKRRQVLPRSRTAKENRTAGRGRAKRVADIQESDEEEIELDVDEKVVKVSDICLNVHCSPYSLPFRRPNRSVSSEGRVLLTSPATRWRPRRSSGCKHHFL